MWLKVLQPQSAARLSCCQHRGAWNLKATNTCAPIVTPITCCMLWLHAGVVHGWALTGGSVVPASRATSSSSMSQVSCTACLTSWTPWPAAWQHWACLRRCVGGLVKWQTHTITDCPAQQLVAVFLLLPEKPPLARCVLLPWSKRAGAVGCKFCCQQAATQSLSGFIFKASFQNIFFAVRTAGPCWWAGAAGLVHDLHPVCHSRHGGLPGVLQPTGTGAYMCTGTLTPWRRNMMQLLLTHFLQSAPCHTLQDGCRRKLSSESCLLSRS